MTFTKFVHSNLISLTFLAYAFMAWVAANNINPAQTFIFSNLSSDTGEAVTSAVP